MDFEWRSWPRLRVSCAAEFVRWRWVRGAQPIGMRAVAAKHNDWTAVTFWGDAGGSLSDEAWDGDGLHGGSGDRGARD